MWTQLSWVETEIHSSDSLVIWAICLGISSYIHANLTIVVFFKEIGSTFYIQYVKTWLSQGLVPG